MRGLPILAAILGILGLLPFLGCTIGIIAFPRHIPVPNLVQAIIAYGAVILAFLGGVHWGFALEADPAITVPSLAATNRRRLTLGVVPSLIGWAALLVPLVASPLIAIVLLIMGFLGTTLIEAQARQAGVMPVGYMALRWVLSAVVVLCLLIVLLARAF
ncbi:DUF3429 domain-containing protein [Lichenicoccus sp.]|uniref:DUF3429 domain-containing protein n=1 Tax=Lichenicoccus sp. TaxID=2781899 RepID=UPI003D10086B